MGWGFGKKKEHPMHKLMKDYEEKEFDREYNKAFKKAKREAMLERAKTEGRKAGLKKPKSWGEKAKALVESVNEGVGMMEVALGGTPQQQTKKRGKKKKKKQSDPLDVII